MSEAAAPATPQGTGRPVRRDEEWRYNMSGVWRVDSARSDPLGPLLAAIGISMVARKVLGVVTVTSHIQQTATAFTLDDKSALGSQKVTLLLDGKPHRMKQIKVADVTASMRGPVLHVVSEFVNDPLLRTEDTRVLVDRDTQRQVSVVYQGPSETCRCVRVLTRVEGTPRPRIRRTYSDVDTAEVGAGGGTTEGAPTAGLGSGPETPGTPSPGGGGGSGGSALRRRQNRHRWRKWRHVEPVVKRVYIAVAAAAVFALLVVVAQFYPRLLYFPALAIIGLEAYRRWKAPKPPTTTKQRSPRPSPASSPPGPAQAEASAASAASAFAAGLRRRTHPTSAESGESASGATPRAGASPSSTDANARPGRQRLQRGASASMTDIAAAAWRQRLASEAPSKHDASDGATAAPAAEHTTRSRHGHTTGSSVPRGGHAHTPSNGGGAAASRSRLTAQLESLATPQPSPADATATATDRVKSKAL